MNNINKLPNELFYHIFSWLDYKSLWQIPLVCKKWRQKTQTDDFYKIIISNTWSIFYSRQLKFTSRKIQFEDKKKFENEWKRKPFLVNEFNNVSAMSQDGSFASLGYKEGNIKIIDIQTGSIVHQLSYTRPNPLHLIQKEDFLAIIYQNFIQIWNWKNNICLKELNLSLFNISLQHFIFDGSYFIFCQKNNIHIWDLNKQDEYVLKEHTQQMEALTLLYPYLIRGTLNGEIKIWNLTTRQFEQKLIAHHRPIIKIGVNESYIVSLSHDNKINIWDWQKRLCIHQLAHAFTIKDIQLKENLLLIQSKTGIFQVWNCRTGKLLKTVDIQNDNQSICEFNYDKIILKSNEEKIELWDIQQDKLLCTLAEDTYKLNFIKIYQSIILTYDSPSDRLGTVRIWQFPNSTDTKIQCLARNIYFYIRKFFEDDGEEPQSILNDLLLSSLSS